MANTKIVLWYLIEISAALIGCCLPVLRPIFSDTWIARLLCRMRDRVCSSFPGSGPSERELEEGIACQSIGGTDFRAISKRESMSRKDSKMSTNIETHEVDEVDTEEESYEAIYPKSKEMGL